ncbi:hypothetical protein LTR02_006237 [Friedmanniomyces endolithicus]|nr:hypothetical protein LTR94_018715 [Friedmanniomyces endolithicus]KAK0771185.1 hypothetical protein LTR59_016202 [Friedmanniomyces endolithicus]KAK0776565.1 hypothetical protein LTR38_015470 [Friedmanniomyces endolithicus]KAK0829213.1 hypothetical protein LTR03_016276 [Friedmanniomyces endolithicus]KAK0905848.1 hypothetical protein LTR02_006237 [Friedmanniomyces endolithicus]
MAESCKAWPRGQCTWGTRCKRVHHKNLDPAQYENREHQEYSVPNDVNVACPRCLAKMLPCDKKGRGGIDDPCSECRWFGGEDCNCVLSVGSSYNDVIWSVMETRERSGYDLPAVKGREAPYGKLGAKIPMPISQARLRPDWKGESREELLGKPDMLPDYVRTLPRAYLVPPGRTSKEARGDAYVPPPVGQERPDLGLLQRKRKGAPGASSTPTAAGIGRSVGRSQLVKQDQDPRRGLAAHTLIEWATGAVMHTYNDGATTTFPGPSGVSAGHSAVPMGAAKQSHTIASQPTPATKPRSPFTTAHASDSGQAGKKQKRGEQTVSNASVSQPPVTPSMSLDTAPTSGWVSMSVEDAPGATDIESDSDWEWARDDNFDD